MSTFNFATAFSQPHCSAQSMCSLSRNAVAAFVIALGSSIVYCRLMIRAVLQTNDKGSSIVYCRLMMNICSKPSALCNWLASMQIFFFC